jgi:hypothetical protein
MFELDGAIQQVVRQSPGEILLANDLICRLKSDFPAVHRLDESNLLTAVLKLFKKKLKRRGKQKE